jgi:hypothetical protein
MAKKGKSGQAVDARGGPAIDPTKNVAKLNKASSKRQDDLRKVDLQLVKSRLNSIEKLGELRARHAAQLRKAESKRIDAVREVDVRAAQTESERKQRSLDLISERLRTSIDSMQSSFNTTAITLAKTSQETFDRVIERIAALERSSAESTGKQTVADPMMTELLNEVKTLRMQQSSGAGRDQGIKMSWGVLVAVILAFSALQPLMANLLRPLVPATAMPPSQVIYVPAPPNTMLPTTPSSSVPPR